MLATKVRGGHVLDAGCGAGALTETLARRGYRVTAIDDSPEFVDYTRRRIARVGMSDRVEVLCLNLETQAIRAVATTGGFDAAVCGEVLEHIDDDKTAVHTIAEALRSGGVLVLSVPAGAARYDWLDRWAGHYRRYERDSLCNLLTEAGLQIDTLIRWGFPSMMLYERFIQRPGLGHASVSGADDSAVARVARSKPVVMAFMALFAIDRLFENRLQRGTGFFVTARRASTVTEP
jgi:SAM-dependent methyltransferase